MNDDELEVALKPGPAPMTEDQLASAPAPMQRALRMSSENIPTTLPSQYRVGALRRLIHAPALIHLMHTAAFQGVVPQVDPVTGIEIGPARAIKPETQLEMASKLLAKALPDMKEQAANYDDPDASERLVEVTADRVRTLTREQLEAELTRRIKEQQAPAHASPKVEDDDAICDE
jgi:hypothetical protein